MFLYFKSVALPRLAVLALDTAYAATLHLWIALHVGMHEFFFAKKQPYRQQSHRQGHK